MRNQAASPASERRSEKVSSLVAREIVRDIAARGLGPGDTLEPESEMMQRYQVARASLREALRILEVHGLIRMKPGPGGGPVVSDVDSREFGRTMTLFLQAKGIRFSELVEARLIIEPLAARLAATRHDPADNDDLRRIVQEGLDAEGDAQWLAASNAFHAKVMSMAGNGLIDLFARALKDIFTERASSVYVARRRGHVRRTHAEIADAIIDGDADVAEELMRAHMEEYVRTVGRREPQLMGEIVDWR
ncbi:FadR/GntR family transcriptional regulator [Prauserella cavernicola]|uniref:FadR family transcriptional regulator n=1 Tax=Prauserella cavernicola TaxID=2800127 RepID=A0A934QVK0_9PSEU|nr:FCD domain-containing protein [Prauserella cavernicola]MBK1787341.1 FadR family transcriptional regulator [Prauserella cavernicola]